MATTNETILLELKVDQAQAKRQITELTKEIAKEKAQIKELSKNYEENAEAITEADLRLKELIREKGAITKATQSVNTVLKSETNSLEQQRAVLSLLTSQYVKLSEEQRNSKDGVLLGKRIKDLTDSLKEQEKAIGDNRRNVGNYTESIKEALSQLNIAGVNVGEFASAVKGGGEQLKVFAKGFTGAAGAARAFVAIPIIALLAGVIAILTQFDDVIDEISATWAGLSSGVKSFLRVFEPVGRQVLDIVGGMLSLLLDTGKAIYNLVTGDFAAFKQNWKDIQKDSLDVFNNTKQLASDAISGKLAKNFADGAKAAYDTALFVRQLTKDLQDLEDVEAKLSTSRAIADAALSKALISAKDRSKTDAERLKLLREADKLVIEQAKNELSTKDQILKKNQLIVLAEANRFDLIKRLRDSDTQNIQRYIEYLNDLGKIKDDDATKTRELLNAQIKLGSDFDQQLQQSKNRQSALLEDLTAEQRAQREAYLKDQLAAIERELIYQQSLDSKRLDLLIARLNKQRDLELNNEKLTAEERALLVANNEAEILKTILQFRVDAISNLGQTLDEEKKKRFEALVDTAKQQSQAAKLEIDLLVTQIERRNQVLTSGATLEKKIAKDTADFKKKQEKEALDTFIKNTQSQLDSTLAIADSLSQINSSLLGEAAQSTVYGKALASVQIAIETAKAIASAIAAATASAAFDGPAATFTTLAKIAANVAAVVGAISQAKKLTQVTIPQPPNRAAGGGNFVTSGPTTLLVGDNPGGRELVTVTPLSGKGQTKIDPRTGLIQMAGGGTLLAENGAALAGNRAESVGYSRFLEAIEKLEVVAKISDIESKQKKKSKTLSISDI